MQQVQREDLLTGEKHGGRHRALNDPHALRKSMPDRFVLGDDKLQQKYQADLQRFSEN